MYEDELAFADSLADEAAEIAMHYFRGEFRVELKPDQTPVTQADLEIERIIRERIAERFPADAVLGEEQGLVGDSDRVWVVDPIDGTKNFTAGIQIWATLVAFVVAGDPVVGVAGAAGLGERYAASEGAGTTLNGEPVHVSNVATLGEASIASSGAKDWIVGPNADGYRRIVTECYRTRGFGDFWGHTLVARGSIEAMLEPGLRTWDWAALKPIIEEAGGRMTSLTGGPLEDHGSALSTNGRVHDEILARLASG